MSAVEVTVGFNHIFSKLATQGHGLNLSTAIVVFGFQTIAQLLVMLEQRKKPLGVGTGMCKRPQQVNLDGLGPQP